jgi:hypothetical protein
MHNRIVPRGYSRGGDVPTRRNLGMGTVENGERPLLSIAPISVRISAGYASQECPLGRLRAVANQRRRRREGSAVHGADERRKAIACDKGIEPSRIRNLKSVGDGRETLSPFIGLTQKAKVPGLTERRAGFERVALRLATVGLSLGLGVVRTLERPLRTSMPKRGAWPPPARPGGGQAGGRGGLMPESPCREARNPLMRVRWGQPQKLSGALLAGILWPGGQAAG